MHTLSSARRTYMASASAVECTATVAIPISLQARRTRSAISPRLAINTLSNIGARGLRENSLLDDDQRLPELDGLAVGDQDTGDHPGLWGRNVVHGLHGLDDEERLPLGDTRAHRSERRGTGLGGKVCDAHHGRTHAARVLAGIVGVRIGSRLHWR